MEILPFNDMAECQTPFTRRDKFTGESRAVPCGKCPNCCARRTSAWSFRLMQEEKVSTSAHFITLTYDTSHVPLTENGYMSLEKRGVQLFLKRLRKLHPATTPTIKYYAVGEYGGKTKRPHYHIIIYNADITLLQPAWPLGQIHYGTVSGASIGYTLKYMSKKRQIPAHRNDDRVPEFALMSKGLGANYLTPAMVKWHYRDLLNRMYCALLDGKKISMPRYYKQILYSDEERKAIGFNARLKQLNDLVKHEADNPNYYRDKFESDKQAFLLQQKNAEKGETL